jgi:hypothetical protein
MAMSEQVELSLMDAANNIREAISFAGRYEHPIIINKLSMLLNEIENFKYIETQIKINDMMTDHFKNMTSPGDDS